MGKQKEYVFIYFCSIKHINYEHLPVWCTLFHLRETVEKFLHFNNFLHIEFCEEKHLFLFFLNGLIIIIIIVIFTHTVSVVRGTPKKASTNSYFNY